MMPMRNKTIEQAEKEASNLPNVRLSAEASRDGKRVKSLREAKWLLVNHLNHDREVTIERIEL